jgi:hypothetical protein
MMTELQLETLQLITSHPPFDKEYEPPKKDTKAFQAHPVSIRELVEELVRRIQEVVFADGSNHQKPPTIIPLSDKIQHKNP